MDKFIKSKSVSKPAPVEESVEETDECDAPFTCNQCDEPLDEDDVRYHCNTCEDFDLCASCAIEEESGHEHELTEVKPKEEGSIFFQLTDPKSGNTLFVGNYHCAVPGSKVLEEYNIKSVLSLMQFERVKEENMKQLESVYARLPNKDTATMKKGVLYYQMDIPDVANPANIKGYPDLFERACLWIDGSLRHTGNCLVHCEQGHRRSPSLFLAWMVTLQGGSVSKAIKTFSAGYQGNSKSKWGELYQEERAEWVKKLEDWEKNWKKKQVEWIKENESLVRQWKSLWTAGKSSSSTASSSLKRKQDVTTKQSLKKLKQ